jgi:hypothetical protein
MRDVDLSPVGNWQSRNRNRSDNLEPTPEQGSNLAQDYSSNAKSDNFLPRPNYSPSLQMRDDLDDEENQENDDYGDDIENEEGDDEIVDDEDNEDGDNEEGSPIGDLRKAQNEARQNKESETKEDVAQVVAEKKFKLITYTLYSLSWKFMYELCCLPILYLWTHFLLRYVGSFKSFCAFVDPNSPEGIKEIISKDEDKTDHLWMSNYLLLSTVIILILTLLAILIYIIIRTMNLSFWDKVGVAADVGKSFITGGGIEEAFSKYLEKILSGK